MIVLSSASTPLLELFSAVPLSPFISAKFSNGMSQNLNYQITDWHKSPSALLFLGRHEATGQQFVIKLLRPYQDTRYSLKTLSKRQQCLLEALRRNRVFTPQLYVGLAPLYCLDLQQRTVCIGEVMENPTRELLDGGTEYVLLMKPQDRDNRLDYLLAKGEITSLMPLVKYISDMHKHRVFSVSLKERLRWGSYDHLMQKLEHNLDLLDFLVDRCNESDWVDRKELAERVIKVKNKARENALRECYYQYFHLRITQRRIKLCHGDIKTPHIWIASDGSYGEEAWSFNILDAIDFNHMYNFIDILSDFAMLMADVQARTQLPTLIDEMIDSYLQKTEQDNELARKVLDYYIIEKAIVGTGISILYDDESQLGRSFLRVAEHRLE